MLKNIKLRYFLVFFFSIILFVFLTPFSLHANSITIKLSKPHHEKDPRQAHPLELLKTALSKTTNKYGPFQIDFTHNMDRDRALSMLKKGEINVHDAPTQPEWEQNVLPIHIPVMKGIMGYRLFLINNNRQKDFMKVKNIEQLKKMSAGGGHQWSTTKVMDSQNFRLVKGTDYQGLFTMLMKSRFDYFPRGINEIFDEYELYKSKHPDMIIETTKAMYIPLPVYFFVTPNEPLLAKRIEDGLMEMLEDGSFDKIFYKYYGAAIKKSNLKDREIFTIKNPRIPDNPVYKKKELWFNPLDNDIY